jgi:hydroxyacylglutathione hydrolase
MPGISMNDLRQLDTQSVALIDTRPWDQFAAGNVPGSLSLPLIKSFCTDAGSLVNEREDIYLIVSPEEREEALRLLIRIGLDRVKGWVDAAQIGSYQDETTRFATIDQVSPAQAESMLADPTMRVLDVRRATEFDEGHIDGAINIAHTRLANRLSELPSGKSLIVHCRSGVRSARATSFLQRKGFKVSNLTGGYLAWAASHIEQPATS